MKNLTIYGVNIATSKIASSTEQQWCKHWTDTWKVHLNRYFIYYHFQSQQRSVVSHWLIQFLPVFKKEAFLVCKFNINTAWKFELTSSVLPYFTNEEPLSQNHTHFVPKVTSGCKSWLFVDSRLSFIPIVELRSWNDKSMKLTSTISNLECSLQRNA